MKKTDKKQCALCLYRVGFGCKRIARQIQGVTHVGVAKWVRKAGIKEQRDSNKLMRMGAIGCRETLNPIKLITDGFKAETKACMDMEGHWINHPVAKLERSRANSRLQSKKLWAAASPQHRMKKALRVRIWKVCKRVNAPKSGRTMTLTGCTEPELFSHLEAKFTGGMSWHNYGTQWEVDHIKPCALFDLTNPEEQKRCFHFSNLQPMPVSLNRRKWRHF